MRRLLGLLGAALVVAGACGGQRPTLQDAGAPLAAATDPPGDGEPVGSDVGASGAGTVDEVTPTVEATAPAESSETPAATAAEGQSAVGRYPERVYVPNSIANTLQVIDPDTYQIIASYPVGNVPHHVTPSWDLSELYVLNTESNSLTVVDPTTGEPTGTIDVTDPYNLYFTPDGEHAIVVAERERRLDIRDPETWELEYEVSVPWPGVDHLAFARDGSYLIASCEFSERIVKVSTETWEVVGEPIVVGGAPIDVVRPPGQDLFFVANQGAGFGGVHVLDGAKFEELSFVPTGAGAHGLLLSADQSKLYVSNRDGGSMSVFDIATQTVTAQWLIPGGGSPDMGQLNPEGDELWISGRYHAEVYVFDTATGELKARIATQSGTHGLTYFPSRDAAHSVGHNGVYWEDPIP